MPGMNSDMAPRFTLIQHHVLDGFPVALSWTSSGRTLAAACSEGKIMLVNIDGNHAPIEWQAHDQPLLAAAWHPSDALLATSGQDGVVKFWRLESDLRPTLVNVLATTDAWVEHLAWRPDGQYLAVASGRDAQIFSSSGEQVNRLRHEASTIAHLAWHPRGTALAISGYGGIDIITGAAHTPARRKLSWQGSLLKCVWRPDGKVLAATCQDNAVHFWRLKENRDASISGYDIKPLALDWSPDSRYLVTGGSPDITTWRFDQNGPEGSAPLALTGHARPVTHLTVQRHNGMVASGCKAGQVMIWPSATARKPLQVMQSQAAIAQLVWHPADAGWLTSVDQQGHLEIWTASTA